MKEFYTFEKVNEHIHCIKSGSGELMYLFEGSERALLMDTSVGVYGLREIVDSLTDKPYDVVITHGHVDHAMGCAEFADKDIYMRLIDLDIYHSMESVGIRRDYVLSGNRREDPDYNIESDEFMPVGNIDFIDLKDGQIFDLGGLHIEILATPGHTQGTIMILDREDKILVSGDAANTFTFLFDPLYSSTVEEYKEMLIDLKKRVDGRYEHLYLCHHVMEETTEMFDELIELCNLIMEGNAGEFPFVFMGDTEPVYAKEIDFSCFKNADGTHANIVYRKNRVRRNVE